VVRSAEFDEFPSIARFHVQVGDQQRRLLSGDEGLSLIPVSGALGPVATVVEHQRDQAAYRRRIVDNQEFRAIFLRWRETRVVTIRHSMDR
jgi:hypothetical protein